jgi:recombinase-like zinc beta ribbon protein
MDLIVFTQSPTPVPMPLHHPRYAGAFCFGRSRQRKHPDGRHLFVRLPREEWTAFIPDAHEGYITAVEFDENVKRLRENAYALGLEREKGPPREGPALLQGLAICAVCGQRMTVRYHAFRGRRVPDYMCQRRGIQRAEPACQQIHGGALDERIGKLLIETVTPVTLEVALTVQKELESRVDEADRLRRQEVERARHDAELARRRYMQVDPDNRMVADTLEADWNAKLRALADAQERCEQRKVRERGLDEEQRARIVALAIDFPRLWNDPRTPDRERGTALALTPSQSVELRVPCRALDLAAATAPRQGRGSPLQASRDLGRVRRRYPRIVGAVTAPEARRSDES